jgi:hypothetical protein
MQKCCGESGLAAQSELVTPLSNIKLLKLNLAVVNRRAEHDGFGCAIAPGRPGQFTPDRRSYAVRLSEVSTKSEVGGVKQALNAISEPECVRSLRQRNVAGAPRDLPVGMFRTPLVRNISADFSSESINLELQPHTLLALARQVRCGGLKVETTAQSETGERQMIAFPVSGTAQLRKSLAQPRRRNHDLGSAKPASLGLTRGQNAVSQQNQCRAVLNAHL